MDVSVSVDELEQLHWRHLRHGAAGVAEVVRALAAEREGTVADVVAEIVRATRSEAPDVAGWAGVVVPFVQAAVEAGMLTLADHPSSQVMPSPRLGS